MKMSYKYIYIINITQFQHFVNLRIMPCEFLLVYKLSHEHWKLFNDTTKIIPKRYTNIIATPEDISNNILLQIKVSKFINTPTEIQV